MLVSCRVSQKYQNWPIRVLRLKTSAALEIPSLSLKPWPADYSWLKTFPFIQTFEGEGNTLIIKQNFHSSANDFLTSVPCFCKRGCCSSYERGGRGRRKYWSAFSKLRNMQSERRASPCPILYKVLAQHCKENDSPPKKDYTARSTRSFTQVVLSRRNWEKSGFLGLIWVICFVFPDL